jgi:NAD(P)-dependent dehydrogenase (short-subunit alcohol dehydrogenase family)
VNPFSYEGKRVMVTGGGGAGIGAATVELLAQLGAEIHTLDIKDPPAVVASHQTVDLRDPDATAEAVEQIGGRINAVFNAAGVSGGGTLSDVDVMLINFVSHRHLVACVTPHMTSGGAVCGISSGLGMGYLMNLQKWMPLVETPDFASAKAWCEAHPDEIAGGYAPSKESLIVWTMHAAMDLNAKGIRLNCISSGTTETPMLTDFEGDPLALQVADAWTAGLGRRSTPAEQAWPMVFLNSDAASYVSGENLFTDGGTVSAMITGRFVLDIDPEALARREA